MRWCLKLMAEKRCPPMKNSSTALMGRKTSITCRFPRRAVCAAASAVFGLALSGTTGAQVLPQEQSLLTAYAPTAQTAGSAVVDLAAGDIDQDGDVDVLTADGQGHVFVLLNRGTP